ncbi:MAG: DUF4214 domain-containing protein [Sulfitobacter sp.]
MGTIGFIQSPDGLPSINTTITHIDSTGLFDTISASREIIGDDFTDYFVFTPSGVGDVQVDVNFLSFGIYTNFLYLVPVSGVSKIAGDIAGSSNGGVHLASETLIRELTTGLAEGSLELVLQPSFGGSTDFSEATIDVNSRDGLGAIWTLTGDPVIIEVIGLELIGNRDYGPNDTIVFNEIDYAITIEPLGKSLVGNGTGGQLFFDLVGESQTHIGSDAIDVYEFGSSRNNLGIESIDGDQVVVFDQRFGISEDTLINIERIRLSDGFLAFDTDGNAGQIYRLYQAAFDRDPDVGGLGHWIDTYDLGLFDLTGVAEEFLKSEEFQQRFGTPETLDNEAYLTLLYANVLDRTPDQAGFDFWSDQQAQGLSRADMLQHFSESPENFSNVASEIDMGIFYI